MNASEGVVDVHSRTSKSMSAEAVFQTSTTPPAGAAPAVGRTTLARYLHFDASSGRFGGLRAAFVGREVRWVCPTHYDELAAATPSK